MRFIVIGAGGFSKEVADLVYSLGHTIVAFVDPDGDGTATLPFDAPVVRGIAGLDFDAATIAIGNSAVRRRMFETLCDGLEMPALVHPSAVVSPYATLGAGTLVMQHATVNADARVEDGVILNVSCCVAHDCVVGAHSHIAPGVKMSGGSKVGAECFCGTSAVLLPGVVVGDRATCGAGAVVRADVRAGATVVGVPAREVGGAS